MELHKELAELAMIKENLKQAKDDATQSWLDSRPLIDELETMQAELATAKNRVINANTTISELQAQLDTTDMSIKSAKGEEEKHHVAMAEINQAQHKTQEEIERHKMKTDEKRRRKSKLKQVLKLKKQTLLTLELTLEAIKLESEAFATSAAQALQHIDKTEAAGMVMIQISQEEYDLLKNRASEQISTAERRISASQEEKLTAESNRDVAFVRLQKLHPQKGSYTRRKKVDKIIGNEDTATKDATGLDHKKAKMMKSRGGVDLRATRPQLNTNPIEDNRNNKKYLVKKKRSICVRIKTFFVRKLSKYFT